MYILYCSSCPAKLCTAGERGKHVPDIVKYITRVCTASCVLQNLCTANSVYRRQREGEACALERATATGSFESSLAEFSSPSPDSAATS